jgi:hypothetical protein
MTSPDGAAIAVVFTARRRAHGRACVTDAAAQRTGDKGKQRYRENAPRELRLRPSLWERVGVRETLHYSRVFMLRGDTGVMKG